MGDVLVRMRLFRLLVRQLQGRGGKGARPQPREFVSPTSRPPILGRAPRKLLRGGDSQGYKIEWRGCRWDVYVKDIPWEPCVTMWGIVSVME